MDAVASDSLPRVAPAKTCLAVTERPNSDLAFSNLDWQWMTRFSSEKAAKSRARQCRIFHLPARSMPAQVGAAYWSSSCQYWLPRVRSGMPEPRR
ncbi:hypothetical protein PG988_005634 [Apiospora saccharicola]